MTGFEFGDIVLVPFPFTDQSATKRRPAAVVSSDAYQRDRRDLIILSQARAQAMVGEAPIARWEEAGLLRPTVFKPVVATIERDLVLRKLGHLADEDRAVLRKVLAKQCDPMSGLEHQAHQPNDLPGTCDRPRGLAVPFAKEHLGDDALRLAFGRRRRLLVYSAHSGSCE